MTHAINQSYFIKGNRPVISSFLEAGFKRKAIAEAYKINYQVLRDDKITAEASKALRPLTQLIPYLIKVFNGDALKIINWLNEGNVAFHGLTPIEMCYIRKEPEVMSFLTSYLDPENREVFRG